MVSQVLSDVCSHKIPYGTPLDVSSVGQFSEGVSGREPSSKYSANDVASRGLASVHSLNSWSSQMAFSKTVYSFTVKEDTLPG